MIRKWIEKKIEARVNEYLANLEVDVEAIAEHVEVDLALVAEHIAASDLVEQIELDDALNDALDYEEVADRVDMRNLADHIEMYDLADYIDKGDIASAFDEDDIASHIEVDPQDVASHIELQALANWVADEDELINSLVENTDFVDNLSDRIYEPVEEHVRNAMVEQCQAATNINTAKVNAIIEAMETIELAVTQMRMTIEGDGDE